MNQFAKTEQSPVSASLESAKQGEASKGLERDGNKPLMRNRNGHVAPSPISSNSSDTF